MTKYVIMSALAVSANDAVECVKHHEHRWEDRIPLQGAAKFIAEHYEKYMKETMTAKDKEHALLELIASSLFVYNRMRTGRDKKWQ